MVQTKRIHGCSPSSLYLVWPFRMYIHFQIIILQIIYLYNSNYHISKTNSDPKLCRYGTDGDRIHYIQMPFLANGRSLIGQKHMGHNMSPNNPREMNKQSQNQLSYMLLDRSLIIQASQRTYVLSSSRPDSAVSLYI